MSLKPLHDWAVIVPAEAETRTAGGLFIPDSAKEKPEEGVVEAIGPGAFEEEKRGKKPGEKKKERRFIPTVLKPGDRVIYGRYAGQTYKVDGEERILVRERDILGILPGKKHLLEGHAKSLQIPASTSKSSSSQIVPVSSQATKVYQQGKETPKVAKKKAVKKKVVKKATKKAAKKAAKKTVKKKATTKKPASKHVKKTVKKTASKKSRRKK